MNRPGAFRTSPEPGARVGCLGLFLSLLAVVIICVLLVRSCAAHRPNDARHPEVRSAR